MFRLTRAFLPILHKNTHVSPSTTTIAKTIISNRLLSNTIDDLYPDDFDTQMALKHAYCILYDEDELIQKKNKLGTVILPNSNNIYDNCCNNGCATCKCSI